MSMARESIRRWLPDYARLLNSWIDFDAWMGEALLAGELAAKRMKALADKQARIPGMLSDELQNMHSAAEQHYVNAEWVESVLRYSAVFVGARRNMLHLPIGGDMYPVLQDIVRGEHAGTIACTKYDSTGYIAQVSKCSSEAAPETRVQEQREASAAVDCIVSNDLGLEHAEVDDISLVLSGPAFTSAMLRQVSTLDQSAKKLRQRFRVAIEEQKHEDRLVAEALAQEQSADEQLMDLRTKLVAATEALVGWRSTR